MAKFEAPGKNEIYDGLHFGEQGLALQQHFP